MQSSPSPDSTVPHIRLYRYLSAKWALRTLKDGRLYVKRISALNDPFEFRPGVRGIDPDQLNDALPALEKFAGCLIRAFDDEFGIICLSTAIEEPVLWSHYADSHQGLALGFDIWVDDKLWKMNYADQRPCFNANQFPDSEAGNKLMRDVLSTKAPSWSYESEYRVHIGLKDAGVHTDSDGNVFRSIPVDCLKHVVIGAMSNVSSEQVEQALSAGGLEGVTVSKARLCHEDFKVRC